jgi:hypothetical protein
MIRYTERQKQEDRALRQRGPVVRWVFVLKDGSTFDAVAACKYGALHVLNRELPNAGHAKLVGTYPGFPC